MTSQKKEDPGAVRSKKMFKQARAVDGKPILVSADRPKNRPES